jgi:hypothetical protein
MKFYDITLHNIFGVGLQYPPNYEHEIGQYNRGHIYYDNKDDGLAHLLISIPDENALKELPKNVVELTETEAKTLGNEFDPSVPTITNEAAVRLVEIKSRLNLALTPKEMDSIDPTKAEPGFGLSESFSDRVEKAKTIETNINLKSVEKPIK